MNQKPKKIDIDTMHAYRDAIRDPSGLRPVRFASILYPGPTVLYGTDIAAMCARPSNTELNEILMTVSPNPAGARSYSWAISCLDDDL
jgi:hypothetical protein